MRTCCFQAVFGYILFSLALLLTQPASAHADAETITYFVAPTGNDSWSGSLANPNTDHTDGPFATLAAACQATRKADTRQPRKIIFAAGQYFLSEHLTLTNKDNDLTIESAPGAKVYLFGGRKVTGWQKDGDKFFSVELPGIKERKWDFRALIVNRRFCPRACLPATGSFEHLSTFDVPWMTTTGGGWKRKPTDQELTTLKYKSTDIGPWLDINNAEITIYHMWDESLVGISAIDTQSNTLTFSNSAGHPPGAFGVKKYVIWNIREGMTQPGQWYLNRSAGKLVYWPLPGEDMTTTEAIAPTIQSIIRIQGTKDKPARDITIKGLTLSVTTTPLEAGGFGAEKFDGAISLSAAESCRLFDLEIFNVGGQGIKTRGNNLLIQRCHIHHTGAGGIRFHGSGSEIADNHIHDIGLTYPSAIALSANGDNCQISHNLIHDTPYSALTCGGQDTRIEHNRIYSAMQQLHDGAGIYCFGGKNIILRGNFIHDIIDTGGYGSSAYYLDETSENCLVEGNLSYNVARPAHNHLAKNNIIRNNVFISNEDARLTFPRSSDYTLEKNIITAKGKIILENLDAVASLKNNILFSAEGKIECHKLNRYDRTGTSLLNPDPTNLQTDPMIVEFQNGKVKLADRSPAFQIGITPIDVSDAGPRP